MCGDRSLLIVKTAKKKMQKQSKIIYKITIPILSIIVTLAILELFFRILGPSHERVTNEDMMRIQEKAYVTYPPSNPFFKLKCLAQSALQHKNLPRMGIKIRDYEYPVKKPQNAIRIIGMGDSFAWGWGVYDFRNTMFKCLECWFNKEMRSEKIEVINFAQPGAGTYTYQKTLATVIQLEPDILLLVYNLNDIQNSYATLPFEALAQRKLDKNPDFLSKISRLYEFIKLRIIMKQARDETIQYYHDSYLNNTKNESWIKAKNILLNLADTCKAHHITFVVIIFPFLLDLEKEYPFAGEVAAIETFLKENGILEHSLLPDFLGKKSYLLWATPSDSHPNAVAHRIAAISIYNYLTQNKLIPPPKN